MSHVWVVDIVRANLRIAELETAADYAAQSLFNVLYGLEAKAENRPLHEIVAAVRGHVGQSRARIAALESEIEGRKEMATKALDAMQADFRRAIAALEAKLARVREVSIEWRRQGVSLAAAGELDAAAAADAEPAKEST